MADSLVKTGLMIIGGVVVATVAANALTRAGVLNPSALIPNFGGVFTSSPSTTTTNTTSGVSDAQLKETLSDGTFRYAWRNQVWRLPAKPNNSSSLCERGGTLGWC